ncbi:lysozyme inhibitor LprI family protein [Pedobacter steynii]|nr:lysozyme inhibitor LprI family protein [Pedobacter steynii]
MKLLLLMGIGLLSFSTATAQAPKEIPEQDLVKMKLKIHKEVDAQYKKLLENPDKDNYMSKTAMDFQMDTTRIEQFMKQRIAIDYSTMGMVQASYDAEKEYDQLLNKYYQQLLKLMETRDKPLLIEVQRNWLKYRDSERKMNALLTEEKYSGGGTIQRVILAAAYLEITKKRVFELQGYLDRI